ncbi:MAG: prepilin-type N-terminal cleavage/methylation domain-containing protein [Candidatus Saccharimonadales bacterium]|jgi:prepilin-type N-terminal cleavage/methylation domain-containing protein
MKIFAKTGVGQRGDTIIEVLISMSILALVLTGAYVSTSRSLQDGTDSSDRQQALALAEQQIEFIKSNPSAYQPPTNSKTNSFCIGNDSSIQTGASCTFNSQYTMTDTYSGGLFTIVATWPSAVGSGGQSQLTLYYRAL